MHFTSAHAQLLIFKWSYYSVKNGSSRSSAAVARLSGSGSKHLKINFLARSLISEGIWGCIL